ncbi:hypothetical protein V1514DRAFT_370406 [Lipomyces japonicus]|uniref:uncharacterized protein n=1 Tax=Lipomyces japonicus TaxID=56871 RepID=UPI0034CF2FCE
MEENENSPDFHNRLGTQSNESETSTDEFLSISKRAYYKAFKPGDIPTRPGITPKTPKHLTVPPSSPPGFAGSTSNEDSNFAKLQKTIEVFTTQLAAKDEAASAQLADKDEIINNLKRNIETLTKMKQLSNRSKSSNNLSNPK